MSTLAGLLFATALAAADQKRKARTWDGSAFWLLLTGLSLFACSVAALAARRGQ